MGTLTACLSWGLQAMAPYAPFVASELLQHVPLNIELKLSDYKDEKLEEEVNEVVNICHNVRQVKSRNEISKRHHPQLSLFAQNTDSEGVLRRHLPQIKVLSRCEDVELELFDESSKISKQLSYFSTAGALCSFGLKLSDGLDLTPEKRDEMQKANAKKLKKLVTELQRYRMRLDNEAFQLMADKKVKSHFENKVMCYKVLIPCDNVFIWFFYCRSKSWRRKSTVSLGWQYCPNALHNN